MSPHPYPHIASLIYVKKGFVFLCALWLLTLCSPTPLRAQDTARAETKRPKVGLVLSGGGARGLVHIGVLRAMEEAGLRPDIITGTSMGAIVGGLYSMGYTPDQISTLNTNANWSELLSNSIPLREVAIDQKKNVGRSLFTLSWRRRKLQLPMGVIESQNLTNFFHQLTWPVADVEYFDDYPTPFRCLAVNLLADEPTVFDRGSLAYAMRASMALPGFFTPVPGNDTAIYVDGGVVDNFPYNTAKKLGADIIIGSYVGPAIMDHGSDYYRPQDIIFQSSMYASLLRAQEDMEKCDILFAPDLDDFSALSFQSGKVIEAIGYQAGQEQGGKLKRLADSLNAIAPQKVTPQVNLNKKIFVKGVTVGGRAQHFNDFIISRLGLKLPDSVSAHTIDSAVKQLYSTLYFKHINYSLQPDNRLLLIPTIRDRFSLQLGFNFNDVWGAGLIGHLAILNPFIQPSRIDLRAEIATQPRIELKHTIYLSRKMRTLFNISGSYSHSKAPLYVGRAMVAALWQHDGEVETTFGHILKNNSLFEAGGRFLVTNQRPNEAYLNFLKIQNPGSLTIREYSLLARIRLNTLDRHFYPNSGQLLYTQANLSFRTELESEIGQKEVLPDQSLKEEFEKSPRAFTYSLKYDLYVPIAKWCTGEFSLNCGLSSSSKGRYSAFFVGGQNDTQRNQFFDFPLYGLGYRQIATHNLVTATIGFRFGIIRNLYITPSFNYLTYHNETLGLFKTIHKPQNWVLGTGLTAGWLTRIGKVEGSVTISTYTREIWWHYLIGFPF